MKLAVLDALVAKEVPHGARNRSRPPLSQKQVGRYVEELGQLADMGLARLPLAAEHIGGHAARTENRQQIGLPQAALIHQKHDRLAWRRFRQRMMLVVIILNQFSE